MFCFWKVLNEYLEKLWRDVKYAKKFKEKLLPKNVYPTWTGFSFFRLIQSFMVFSQHTKAGKAKNKLGWTQSLHQKVWEEDEKNKKREHKTSKETNQSNEKKSEVFLCLLITSEKKRFFSRPKNIRNHDSSVLLARLYCGNR